MNIFNISINSFRPPKMNYTTFLIMTTGHASDYSIVMKAKINKFDQTCCFICAWKKLTCFNISTNSNDCRPK